MPTNSFRLFVVSLHDDRMPDRQPFNAAQPRPLKEAVQPDAKTKRQKFKMVAQAPVDYAAEAIDEVNSHPTDKAFVFGKKIAEDDDATAATVIGHALRWTKASNNTGMRLWFEAGPTSEDGVVVDLSGKTSDLDLRGRATLHPYRALLVTAPGLEYGLLAVEKRGRSCPKDQVVRALHETSNLKWRLRVHAGAAEKASVLDYIDRSTINAVTFTELGYAKDKQKAPPLRKRLRVAEVPDGGFDAIKDAVRSWVRSTWKDGNAAAAAQLKALVITEEVDIAFNDVAVEFDDDQLQRAYKPTSDFDQFSYWLGNEIVNDTKFFDAASKAAADLLPEVQAVVDLAE